MNILKALPVGIQVPSPNNGRKPGQEVRWQLPHVTNLTLNCYILPAKLSRSRPTSCYKRETSNPVAD